MKWYRRILLLVLLVSLAGGGLFGYYMMEKSIPDEIKIIASKEQEFNFGLPIEASISSVKKEQDNKIHLNLSKPVTMVADQVGSYQMECSFLGLFRLKNVNIHVIEDKMLIPCGLPIGIYIETQGVMVIGTGAVNGMDGMNYEPAYHIVQSGDYIETVNQEPVKNKYELINKINQYGDKEIVLGVRRNDGKIQLKLTPVNTAPGEYKLGIWVRDNTQGIGTLTYVDAQGGFGALGHGINDVDTSILMEMEDGILYETEIISVMKGESGIPGELTGIIHYKEESKLGRINSNTPEGIFGTVNEKFLQEIDQKSYPLCMKQNIKLGKAYVRSNIEGSSRDYEVRILDVNMNGDSVNKGIVLQVTDQELLQKTGGIVQGMSGSPILQDGKIIGAVTHVFVQDATKGYGIFIENMIRSQN